MKRQLIGVEDRTIIVDGPASVQEEDSRAHSISSRCCIGEKGPEFDGASGSVAFRARNLTNEATQRKDGKPVPQGNNRPAHLDGRR